MPDDDRDPTLRELASAYAVTLAWLVPVLAVGVPRAVYHRARIRLGADQAGAGIHLIDVGDHLLPPASPLPDFAERLLARLEEEMATMDRGGAT